MKPRQLVDSNVRQQEMPLGLTLDQLIQIGLLAAAIVPLMVLGIKAGYVRHRGLRISVRRVDSTPAYVLEVSQEAGRAPYVATAGVWCEVLLMNSSRDAIAVRGLAAGDPLSASSPCALPYFLEVAGTRASVSITQTVQPPFQVLPGDVRKFYVICPVKLPEAIGEFLTSVASRGILGKGPVDPVRNINVMLEGLAQELASDLPDYIQLKSVAASAVSLQDPLFRISGNEVHVDPKFGEINQTALIGFYSESLRNPGNNLHSIRSPSRFYRVSATLASGKVFYGQLSTGRMPLWFLSQSC